MKNFFSICGDERVCSLALGKFDGMHRGHQELFGRLCMPGAILVIDAEGGNLTPGALRSEFTSLPICAIPFSEIKNLGAEEFIALLLRAFPLLKRLVVGYDFRFGRNRAYGISELRALFGGEVVVVEEIFYQGISVHSGAIRERILRGAMGEARALLGRDYFIEGTIIRGQGIGHNELVATLNLHVERFLLPRPGVYASKTRIAGLVFHSVSFVGNRLSTDGEFAIETHLLQDTGESLAFDLSSINQEVKKIARIHFIEYIRENIYFRDISKLKEQIFMDIKKTQEILKQG